MLLLTRRNRVISAAGQDPAGPDGTSRRSFLRSSGGVAAVVAVPSAAVAIAVADAEAASRPSAPARAIKNPTRPAPDQPVMAYVHDAKRGVVVIMSGDSERTVRDHELVRRLLHKPGKRKAKRRTTTAQRTGA